MYNLVTLYLRTASGIELEKPRPDQAGVGVLSSPRGLCWIALDACHHTLLSIKWPSEVVCPNFGHLVLSA